MTRWLALVVVVLAAASRAPLTVAFAPPQSPLARGQPTQPSVAVIEGSVVDAADDRPIAGAVVRVRSLRDRNSPLPAALTSADGRFRLTGVPPDIYEIEVRKAGYLPRPGSQQQDPLPSLGIGPGFPQRALMVRLTRTAAVRGRVVNADRDPVAGVSVEAVDPNLRGRDGEVVVAARTVTDDLGEYELANLRSGRYLVAVRLSHHTSLVNPRSRRGVVLAPGTDRPLPVRGQMSDDGRFMLDMGAVPSPLADGRPAVYVTSFHPGVTSAKDAATVDVRAGMTQSPVDIQLVQTARVAVAGTVMGPSGPMAQTILRLDPADSEAGVESLTVGSHDDGTFHFMSVPVGAYSLFAYRSLGESDIVVRDPEGLWARSTIGVDEQGVRGLVVSLAPGFSIGGRVLRDDGKPIGSTSVRLIGVDRGAPDGRVQASADGSFYLTGVVPGRYLLSIYSTQFLLSAVRNGRDHADEPLEVGSDVSGLVLTLAERPGEISGMVIHQSPDAARPVTDVMVFPARADERFLHRTESRRIRSSRVDPAGRYRFERLPPGDYLVAAVDPASVPGWPTNDLMTSIAADATPVTLGVGEQRVVDLRRPRR